MGESTTRIIIVFLLSLLRSSTDNNAYLPGLISPGEFMISINIMHSVMRGEQQQGFF
jgi:hypothetical protein